MLLLGSGDNEDEDVTDDVWRMDFKEIRRVAIDALNRNGFKDYQVQPTKKNQTDDKPPCQYQSCEFHLKEPKRIVIRIDQPYVGPHWAPKDGRISSSPGSFGVVAFNYKNVHSVIPSYIYKIHCENTPQVQMLRRDFKERKETEGRIMQALWDSIQQATVDQFVTQVCEGAYDAILKDHVNTPNDLSLKDLLEDPLIEIIAKSPGWNSNYEASQTRLVESRVRASLVHRFVFQTCERARQAVPEAQALLEVRHLKDLLQDTLIDAITRSPAWDAASQNFNDFKNKLSDVLASSIHLHSVDALVAELCTSARQALQDRRGLLSQALFTKLLKARLTQAIERSKLWPSEQSTGRKRTSTESTHAL